MFFALILCLVGEKSNLSIYNRLMAKRHADIEILKQ